MFFILPLPTISTYTNWNFFCFCNFFFWILSRFSCIFGLITHRLLRTHSHHQITSISFVPNYTFPHAFKSTLSIQTHTFFPLTRLTYSWYHTLSFYPPSLRSHIQCHETHTPLTHNTRNTAELPWGLISQPVVVIVQVFMMLFPTECCGTII